MRKVGQRLALLEQALLPDAGPMPNYEVLKAVIGRLTHAHLELLSNGLKAKRDGRTPTEQERAAQRALDLLVQRESRCARPDPFAEFLIPSERVR